MSTQPKTENLHAPLPDNRVSPYSLIDTCRFHFRTLDEAEALCLFAGYIFPDPARATKGLYELLVNAVEHGCLGIGYDLKTDLVEKNVWRAEVERRLSLPDNRQKNIEMIIARKTEGVFAIITDPGAGFDWKLYMGVEPSRAGDNHGRGIARALSVSFDTLTYNPKGNQVVAFMRPAPDLEW